VAFRPDGKAVLTGSADQTARLWSAQTGRPLGPPLRQQSWVWAVAFSPDGKAVLTGSEDGTARLWSAATGQPIGPPLRHQRGVTAVAFSPDGKVVLTGSYDQTARLWTVGRVCQDGPERVKLQVQVATGTELDPHGVVRVLDGPSWQRRRQELLQAGQPPSRPKEDPLAWHRREVIDAEIAGQWFAAAWHLNPLIAAAPADPELWKERGRAHANLEQWEKASLDFAKASQLAKRDLQAWTDYTLLRLHLGDEKGYRQACALLLKRWGAANDPQTLNTVVWICTLGPSALTDLKPVLRLAEKAVEKAPNNSGILNILGAILYRVGRSEEAVKRLKEAVARNPRNTASTFNWLFLAMAQQQLGHTEEAKRCLARGGEFLKAEGIRWHARLEMQTLHREAEALVKGSKR
jgi:WD40 repeat protein